MNPKPRTVNFESFYEVINSDGLVKICMDTIFVIPAKAGIQSIRKVMDSGTCPGLRSGNAGVTGFSILYEVIKE